MQEVYIHILSLSIKSNLLKNLLALKKKLLFPTVTYLTLFAKEKDTHFAYYVGNVDVNIPLLQIKKKNKKS